MARHYYSDTAVATTLTAGMDTSQVTMDVAAVTGFPASFPYYLVIDRGVAASLEVVRVTSAASLTLTITRAVTVPTTAAVSHLSGAAVLHVVGAEFFNNADLPPGACIAKISRTTTSTASTAATGVLRLDDVPIKVGRFYWVSTSTLEMVTSIAGTIGQSALSITTDGSTPTTASTLGVAAVQTMTDLANGASTMAGFFYGPPSDLNFSVLLWTKQVGGSTGTVALYADAVAICTLFIIDLGVTPPTYGTVL